MDAFAWHVLKAQFQIFFVVVVPVTVVIGGLMVMGKMLVTRYRRKVPR